MPESVKVGVPSVVVIERALMSRVYGERFLSSIHSLVPLAVVPDQATSLMMSGWLMVVSVMGVEVAVFPAESLAIRVSVEVAFVGRMMVVLVAVVDAISVSP